MKLNETLITCAKQHKLYFEYRAFLLACIQYAMNNKGKLPKNQTFIDFINAHKYTNTTLLLPILTLLKNSNKTQEHTQSMIEQYFNQNAMKYIHA